LPLPLIDFVRAGASHETRGTLGLYDILPGAGMCAFRRKRYMGISPAGNRASSADGSSPDRLRDDVHVLGDLVGQILREQAGERLFALVEQVRTSAISLRSHSPDPETELTLLSWAAGQSTADLAAIVRAFSVYFHVINMAEEHHRVRVLRERDQGDTPLPESIAAAVAILRDLGATAEDFQRTVADLAVNPVFTAHPSEARRRTILFHLERIAHLLDALDDPRLSAPQRAGVRNELSAEVTLLWQTAETQTERPTALDEVQSILGVLAGVLYDVAPRVQESVAGIPALEGRPVPPFLRLCTWVGGDRDGNPHVNPDVTRAAARLARREILRRYRDDVQALGRDLSVSARECGASSELLDSLENDLEAMHVQRVEAWADEPYRRKCGLIAERLNRTLSGESGGYDSPDQLIADLELMRQSLLQHHGRRIAEGSVRDLIDRASIFGFHLAEIEVRQHALRHTAAVTELLHLASGAGHFPAEDFTALDETSRAALLAQNLEGPPFALPLEAFSLPTREVLETLSAIAHIQRQMGQQACQTYIISMSQAASDVLAVQLLAREAGLFRWDGAHGAEARLDIVPLFEEVEELERCSRVMARLFAVPAYRALLAARGMRQQVMIGYSDSNKAAGYVAATWHTYQAQADLAEVAKAHGVRLEIFHGRGGAVGRGGGPMERAIQARPASALFPRLKVTEQGEVIFARYGHPAIAERHFNQIIYGLLLSALGSAEAPPTSEWVATIERMVALSRAAYVQLTQADQSFLGFFRRVTPFTELSSLNIASRPVSRSGNNGLGRLDDLRAIPWSFSWAQVRANLPGWYGLGTALEREITQGHLANLQSMYQEWRFFTTAIDNAQRSLGTADMRTFRRYLALAEPGDMPYADRILAEYEQSVSAVLKVTNQQALLEHTSTLAGAIRLRNPYLDALHVAQIELLQRLRALPAHATAEERAALLDIIHHSINGIAVGLQTTG
jgi:phosphoenolpyruvate carboxylase